MDADMHLRELAPKPADHAGQQPCARQRHCAHHDAPALLPFQRLDLFQPRPQFRQCQPQPPRQRRPRICQRHAPPAPLRQPVSHREAKVAHRPVQRRLRHACLGRRRRIAPRPRKRDKGPYLRRRRPVATNQPQRRLQPGGKPCRGFRRRHAARMPLEQRQAQLRLQFGDPLRHRRLRQIDRAGRQADGPLRDHGGDGGQVPDIELIRCHHEHLAKTNANDTV